jgi:2-polyprenyl-3-methyl-5-hydroxy-6-metoxy-1,4-benzoquinol methylase
MSAAHRVATAEGIFTCVVDEHPRFHLDALRWFASLTEVAGVAPSDLVVHVIGEDDSDVLNFLRNAGAVVRGVDRFDARSPHCNKISGALRLAQEPLDGLVVLCDTDIAVMEDPRRLDVAPGAMAAKVVDAPVPPLEVLQRVFTASGLPTPATIALPWGPGDHTLSGNSNGGLYLVPGPLLGRVANAWAEWAGWLLNRIELLEDWRVHVDQVAMALATAAEGIVNEPLAVQWNTPTHDPTRIPDDPPVPYVVHYHQQVDRRGLIAATGHAPIDRRLAEANDAISSLWARAAPDKTYEQWLDETPRRDDTAALVGVLADALRPASILDVGGDSAIGWGNWEQSVTRLDWSGDLVRSLADADTSADLVLCLEELCHLRDEARARDLLRLLWQSTARALVVRVPHRRDGAAAGATVEGGPATMLGEVASGAELYPLGTDGACATYVAYRESGAKHPRDFGPPTLAPLVTRHPDPRTLLELRLHALGTTGFYPDHAPRLWEYPVVATLITEHLPRGSRLLDVGAGVTPLAPYLTSRGYVVETVDPSTVVREWPPQPDWNEWDFLDYGAAGLAHRSWNCTLDQLPTEPPFDGAYSISVIEHVPSNIRRCLLRDISARTALGGLVVLTIDLVRGADDLWNRNLGVVVEDIAHHGTFDDVVGECAAVGLETFARETVRDWGDTRVDIGLLALRKTAEPPVAQRHGTRQRLWALVRSSRR